MENSPKVPCILHMDSIKGSHRGLKNLIQSYLWEEWKARTSDPVKDISSKFLNLRFVPLELPQQQNSFDCGLFLLHYMELFVEQAPVNFSPSCTSKSSTFLNKDWFPPAVVSFKRAHIKTLIYEIAGHNSQKAPLSASNDNCSSEFTDVNEEGTEVEFLHESYNSKETSHGSYSDANANGPIVSTPLAAKPLRSVPCLGESEFPEPGDYGGSLIDEYDQPSGQMILHNQINIFMSPIEEGEEISDQTSCSPIEEACGQQLALIPKPSVKKIREVEMHWTSLLDFEEYEKGDQTSGTSSGGSPVSSEVQENKNYPPEELLHLSPEKDEAVYECSSTSSDELESLVVEDSQEKIGKVDVGVCENSPCQRRIFASSYRKAEKTVVAASHMPPVLDSEEVQVSKRPRHLPPEVGRRLTRSLSKHVQEIVLL